MVGGNLGEGREDVEVGVGRRIQCISLQSVRDEGESVDAGGLRMGMVQRWRETEEQSTDEKLIVGRFQCDSCCFNHQGLIELSRKQMLFCKRGECVSVTLSYWERWFWTNFE